MHSPIVAAQQLLSSAPSPIVYCSGATGSPPQQQRRSSTTTLDTCIFVQYFDDDKVEVKEHSVYAHRLILGKSPFFAHQLALFDEQQQVERRRKEEQQQLLSSSSTVIYNCSSSEETEQLSPITTLRLDLSMAKDALHSFKIFLNFLYGGQVNVAEGNPETLLFLAKLCGVPALELEVTSQLTAAAQMAQNTTRENLFNKLFRQQVNTPTPIGGPFSTCTPNENASIVHPNIYEAYLQLQSLLQTHTAPEVKPVFGVNPLLQLANQHSSASPTDDGMLWSLQKAMAMFKQTQMPFLQQQSAAQGQLEEDRKMTDLEFSDSSDVDLSNLEVEREEELSDFEDEEVRVGEARVPCLESCYDAVPDAWLSSALPFDGQFPTYNRPD